MITTTGGKCSLVALMKCAGKHLLALVPALVTTLVLTLVTALVLTPAATVAQSSEDTFRGTWQVQTPAEGALIILLQNQGIASYFWGDNADRNVYQGSWTYTDTIATVTWEDGASHRIERTDSGLSVTSRSASGDRRYDAPAEQIPQEKLGQWAKPPSREDEMRSDRDKAQGFFGIWQLADLEDLIFVESDRATASNIGEGAGQRGQWAKQGSELHIIWDSGEYGILRETERGFDYKQVESGQIIEDDETETVAAARTIEAKVPSDWFADYKTEREADSDGIAFSSRKVARSFYRGDWLVRRGENTFEKIELARFGGLKTSRDRSLGGQWTMSGQDVFMRWDDGMRQVLSPVGRGFILYAYQPGRPLDGVPTRILAAAPADTTKLAEHLEDRKDVAKQMREMAEAAGIDPAAQEDVGWGRTFARWAWPFGDNSDGMTSGEMLEEEYAEEATSDPWWWPFWSETPSEESDETGDAAETTVEAAKDPATQPDDAAEDETPAAEDETPREEAEQAPLPVELKEVETLEEKMPQATTEEEEEEEEANPPAKKKRTTTKDWLWPF